MTCAHGSTCDFCTRTRNRPRTNFCRSCGDQVPPVWGRRYCDAAECQEQKEAQAKTKARTRPRWVPPKSPPSAARIQGPRMRDSECEARIRLYTERAARREPLHG